MGKAETGTPVQECDATMLRIEQPLVQKKYSYLYKDLVQEKFETFEAAGGTLTKKASNKKH